MDLHTPEDVPDTPAQRAADRRRLILALNASLAFVLLLAAAFALQHGADFRALTVAAREPAGLLGILTAPLLHGSFEHIAANAGSLLLLGTLALAVYPKATLRAWVGNLEANWDEAVAHSSAGRARVWRLYMAGAALSFAANRLGINQVLAVKCTDRGRSGMPGTRTELLQPAVPAPKSSPPDHLHSQ